MVRFNYATIITSNQTLTADELLEAGQKHLGDDYTQLGKPDSGVFRSNQPNPDGTVNQFRIDRNSLSGGHDPYVPHGHLEIVKPGVKDPVVNNHIPFTE